MVGVGKVVDRILAAKKAALAADTSAWERDRRSCGAGIDERVYRLYGLTEDEIKIMDPASSRRAGLRRVRGRNERNTPSHALRSHVAGGGARD